jgi:hypothetical protein
MGHPLYLANEEIIWLKQHLTKEVINEKISVTHLSGGKSGYYKPTLNAYKIPQKKQAIETMEGILLSINKVDIK